MYRESIRPSLQSREEYMQKMPPQIREDRSEDLEREGTALLIYFFYTKTLYIRKTFFLRNLFKG